MPITATLLSQLKLQFDMTDLGLEVLQTTAVISVTQTKYTKDVLQRFSMTGCETCNTPISLSHSTDITATKHIIP